MLRCIYIFLSGENMSQWTASELMKVFNATSAKDADALADTYRGRGLRGTVVDADPHTNEPLFTLIFTEGSKPDLSSLPRYVGDSKVRTLFKK